LQPELSDFDQKFISEISYRYINPVSKSGMALLISNHEDGGIFSGWKRTEAYSACVWTTDELRVLEYESREGLGFHEFFLRSNFAFIAVDHATLENENRSGAASQELTRLLELAFAEKRRKEKKRPHLFQVTNNPDEEGYQRTIYQPESLEELFEKVNHAIGSIERL
jgi:hypothetical protein